MRQPLDPKIARALVESAKANAAILEALTVITQTLSTAHPNVATKLSQQQSRVQSAVSRQIDAVNEALRG